MSANSVFFMATHQRGSRDIADTSCMRCARERTRCTHRCQKGQPPPPCRGAKGEAGCGEVKNLRTATSLTAVISAAVGTQGPQIGKGEIESAIRREVGAHRRSNMQKNFYALNGLSVKRFSSFFKNIVPFFQVLEN